MILQTRRSDPPKSRYCRSAPQNRIGLKLVLRHVRSFR